jgi:hypothetical protein
VRERELVREGVCVCVCVCVGMCACAPLCPLEAAGRSSAAFVDSTRLDVVMPPETTIYIHTGTKTAPSRTSSATQQQVSETLCHMGLSVEDEVRCPKSGYSIDMLLHDSTLGIGGESSSSASTWAV